MPLDKAMFAPCLRTGEVFRCKNASAESLLDTDECKSIGRRNPHNVVKATIVALESLRDRNAVAEMRGLAVEKL